MKANNEFIYNSKILVVDDMYILATDIKSILTELGFNNIITACTVDDALKVASNNKLDLLIMDINLNDRINGYELSNKIQRFNKCKTIFMSAYSMIDPIIKIIMQDPNGLIIKPVNSAELVDKIIIKLNGNNK
jgi:two-component system response regulator YesN